MSLHANNFLLDVDIRNFNLLGAVYFGIHINLAFHSGIENSLIL